MSSTATPVLRARRLHRFFRAGRGTQVLALREVSIEVAAGEMVAVVGPSGSGKSTLLSCLAGLDVPDAGTIEVAGQMISDATEADRTRIRARSVGVLMQTGNLIDHLTVVQNVDLARRLAGHRGRKRPVTDPSALMDRLGLTEQADRYPSRLSGGESARAGLAVALAADPAVLLADEPTGELDTHTEREVLAVLGDTCERGTAIVLASHAPEACAVAGRRIVLRDGAVVGADGDSA